MDLKAETIGLAVALELPLLVIDVQRAGPSTGMPTKTEAADLLMAIHGRHGESPLPVIAAATPAQCFEAVFESVRIAVRYRTPVILLSDTFLANSSEPWQLPERSRPAADRSRLRHRAESRGASSGRTCATTGWPGPGRCRGRRASSTWSAGSRRRTRPATSATRHENHARMTRLRAEKIAGIASDIGELEVDDPDGAELLVLGWGSTYGAIKGAVRRVRLRGKKVAAAHLHHLNPLPSNTGEVVRSYPKVLIPEMNTGQLVKIIRAEFLVDALSYSKVEGLPIFAEELDEAIVERL